MLPSTKPRLWRVVKSTGGTSFIERGNKRFAMLSDERATHEICAQLNIYERKIARLENKLAETILRS